MTAKLYELRRRYFRDRKLLVAAKILQFNAALERELPAGPVELRGFGLGCGPAAN